MLTPTSPDLHKKYSASKISYKFLSLPSSSFSSPPSLLTPDFSVHEFMQYQSQHIKTTLNSLTLWSLHPCNSKIILKPKFTYTQKCPQRVHKFNALNTETWARELKTSKIIGSVMWWLQQHNCSIAQWMLNACASHSAHHTAARLGELPMLKERASRLTLLRAVL